MNAYRNITIIILITIFSLLIAGCTSTAEAPTATVDVLPTDTAETAETATAVPSPTFTPKSTNIPTPLPTDTPVPTPTPQPTANALAPEVILGNMRLSLANLKSFHYESEWTISTSENEDRYYSDEADVLFPDRFQGISNLGYSGGEKVSYIWIGDILYAKDPETNKWQGEQSQTTFSFEDYLKRLIPLQDLQKKSLAVEGIEIIDGVSTYKLSGLQQEWPKRLSGDSSVALMDDLTDLEGEFVVTYWISQEDFLPIKSTTIGELTSTSILSVTFGFDMTTNWSNFDAEFAIDAPEGSDVIVEELPKGGDLIEMDSYYVQMPAGDNWNSTADPTRDIINFSNELGPLAQIVIGRNIINRDLELFTAEEVADDYLRHEENIMLTEGVDAGLYEFEYLNKGTTIIGGKEFYYMTYKLIMNEEYTGGVSMFSDATIYLYFPDEFSDSLEFYYLLFSEFYFDGEPRIELTSEQIEEMLTSFQLKSSE